VWNLTSITPQRTHVLRASKVTLHPPISDSWTNSCQNDNSTAKTRHIYYHWERTKIQESVYNRTCMRSDSECEPEASRHTIWRVWRHHHAGRRAPMQQLNQSARHEPVTEQPLSVTAEMSTKSSQPTDSQADFKKRFAKWNPGRFFTLFHLLLIIPQAIDYVINVCTTVA